MTKQEPKQEQIQWFWEQCGFKPRKCWSDPNDIIPRHEFTTWDYPDGSGSTQHLSVNPSIDLNNLFKYAVPKVNQITYADVLLGDWVDDFYINELDPALALFWAIFRAFGGKE